MMSWIRALIVFAAVLIFVGILLVAILGPILVATGIPFVVVVGDAFVKWGWVLALAIALYAVWAGGFSFTFPRPGPPRQ